MQWAHIHYFAFSLRERYHSLTRRFGTHSRRYIRQVEPLAAPTKWTINTERKQKILISVRFVIYLCVINWQHNAFNGAQRGGMSSKCVNEDDIVQRTLLASRFWCLRSSIVHAPFNIWNYLISSTPTNRRMEKCISNKYRRRCMCVRLCMVNVHPKFGFRPVIRYWKHLMFIVHRCIARTHILWLRRNFND